MGMIVEIDIPLVRQLRCDLAVGVMKSPSTIALFGIPALAVKAPTGNAACDPARHLHAPMIINAKDEIVLFEKSSYIELAPVS
jgi:hypothetical protein